MIKIHVVIFNGEYLQIVGIYVSTGYLGENGAIDIQPGDAYLFRTTKKEGEGYNIPYIII